MKEKLLVKFAFTQAVLEFIKIERKLIWRV